MPYNSADFGRRDELVYTRKNNTAHKQKHLFMDSAPLKKAQMLISAAAGLSRQVLPILLRHGSLPFLAALIFFIALSRDKLKPIINQLHDIQLVSNLFNNLEMFI